MTRWSIFYGDGSRLDGETVEQWLLAPVEGVQVVVRWSPPAKPRWGLAGRPIVRDRELWTGEDVYDPFETGCLKMGSLIDDETYHAIFERAAYGDY